MEFDLDDKIPVPVAVLVASKHLRSAQVALHQAMADVSLTNKTRGKLVPAVKHLDEMINDFRDAMIEAMRQHNSMVYYFEHLMQSFTDMMSVQKSIVEVLQHHFGEKP